jgi:hypothetical protein
MDPKELYALICSLPPKVIHE